MSVTVKKVLAGIILFGSGLVMGFIGARLVAERGTLALLHGDSKRFAEMALERLSLDLGLTAQQREKLRPVFGETAKKMAELRREQEPKIHEILDKGTAAIKDVLTPEQRETFDTIVKRVEKRRRDMERFGPPPPPPGFGPPPPGMEPPPPHGLEPPLGLGPPPGPPPGGHPPPPPGHGPPPEREPAI